MSAAHATVTAVTAASVATAHRVKKVLQNTPTTAKLLSTTTLRMTTRQTSKPRKKPARHVSHANRVNHVSNASLVVNAPSALTARHVTHRVKRLNKLHQQPKPLHAKACRISKRSHCLWQRCKPWLKAAAWNGSTPIQTASPPCKQPSQPSQSLCMCHASAHRW